MMTTENFIAGKEASLESTICTMRNKLSARGFDLQETGWLHPVQGVWSVHMHDKDCPMLFSNGKGATELAARASALGEFCERISTHHYWSHFYLGKTRAEAPFVHYPQERWFPLAKDSTWHKALLTPDLQAFYNPEGEIPDEMLVDLNSGNAQRGICALPYTRLRDSQKVWFPVNIVGNLYVSNGLSAGNTLMEARTQALSEIFERAIKFRVIRDAMCLPEVPEKVIARYPAIAAGIKDLREAGFGILVRDASLGGQYPVMNVTLLHPKDQGCFVSFGAHPRFEIALERALTELLQGRALGALEGFSEPSFDAEEIACTTNLEIHFVDASGVVSWNFLRDQPDFPFVDWNFSSTVEEDYNWCVSAIHAEGKDIYVTDFTEQGVYACRIIVPGMSEIYPVEDLEWENNSLGNSIRPMLLNIPELTDSQCRALFDELEQMGAAQEEPLWEMLGIAVPEGSVWKTLRIGELKALLALATGDKQAALEACQWVTQYKQIAPHRELVYRCVETLLHQINPEPYQAALLSLYGKETLDLAQALVARENRFFGLNKLGEDIEGSPMHQALLAAYDKLFVV